MNELEALKREVQNYGYASAYGAMTWLHNMGWSGFISLSVIHAKRMEGRTIQIEVFRKYEQATLSELDSLVKQGVLFKRTELNNLSHEVWYKLVHIPRIARVV